MGSPRYLYQRLCNELNPVSVKTFRDSTWSLFLEFDDPDARIDVYVSTPAKEQIERSSRQADSVSSWAQSLSFELCDGMEDATLAYESEKDKGHTFAPQRSKLVALRGSQELKQYLKSAFGFQAFFIKQSNSYSPLAVTHELFETLLLEKNVSSQFKDFILYMGQRQREVEITTPRLRWRVTPAQLPDGTARIFECMYGLRFVELNGRGRKEYPTSQWSLRQSAIYCSSQPGGADGTLILVTPSKAAERRLKDYLFECSESSTPDPIEIYLLLLDTAVANWRPYLVDMAAEIDEHASQLLGASPDDRGPISMAECGERQALMILDDKLLNAALVIKSTTDDLTSQFDYYTSFGISHRHSEPDEHTSTTFLISEQLKELRLLSLRIESLRSRLQGITNLVSSFLDLSSGFALQDLAKESSKENEQMRKLSERMHKLTEKATQDAAAVKVLTILTLIYLPATVVSNFFSTSFVNSEPASGIAAHIVVSNDWWIFVAAAIPLTMVTLYVWLVWMRIQAYRRYPWWWIFGRDDSLHEQIPSRPIDSDLEKG